ncbi:MAG: hypothetical protein ACI8TL_000167 [Natronomonas sp.]|jgi:hypothetical protein
MGQQKHERKHRDGHRQRDDDHESPGIEHHEPIGRGSRKGDHTACGQKRRDRRHENVPGEVDQSPLEVRRLDDRKRRGRPTPGGLTSFGSMFGVTMFFSASSTALSRSSRDLTLRRANRSSTSDRVSAVIVSAVAHRTAAATSGSADVSVLGNPALWRLISAERSEGVHSPRVRSTVGRPQYERRGVLY